MLGGRINRREFIAALGGTGAGPMAAWAQQTDVPESFHSSGWLEVDGLD